MTNLFELLLNVDSTGKYTLDNGNHVTLIGDAPLSSLKERRFVSEMLVLAVVLVVV